MSVQSKFNALELLTRIRAANALIPDGQPSGDSIHAVRSPDNLANRNDGVAVNRSAYDGIVDSKINSPLTSQSSSQNRAPSNISNTLNTQSVAGSFSPMRNIINANVDQTKKYGSNQQGFALGTPSPGAGESVNESRRFAFPDQPSFLNSPVHDGVITRYKDTYDLDDDWNAKNGRKRIGNDSLHQYNQNISQNIPDCNNQSQGVKNKNNNHDQNKQSIRSDLSHEERFSPSNINFNFNNNRSNHTTPNYVANSDADTIPYNAPYNILYDFSDARNISPISAEIHEELNRLRLDNLTLNRKIRILTIQKSEIERRSREAKIKNDDIIAKLRCK